MASIKKGTPNLTWSLAQLEAWWAVKGKKQTDETWDERECVYIKSKPYATNLRDYDGVFAGEIGAIANCCGVGELGNFLPDGADEFSFEQLCALAVQEVRVRKFKCLIATTARQPLEEKVLRAIGFKAVSTFVNPNSNNKVTLWHVTIK